jgi:F-box associated protein
MEDLPSEVIALIFDLLPFSDWVRFRSCCAKFRKISSVQNPRWKRLCARVARLAEVVESGITSMIDSRAFDLINGINWDSKKARRRLFGKINKALIVAIHTNQCAAFGNILWRLICEADRRGRRAGIAWNAIDWKTIYWCIQRQVGYRQKFMAEIKSIQHLIIKDMGVCPPMAKLVCLYVYKWENGKPCGLIVPFAKDSEYRRDCEEKLCECHPPSGSKGMRCRFMEEWGDSL